MDLWVREARIFTYGSGVGTNFSNLRGEGERLSGCGTSSGANEFPEIGIVLPEHQKPGALPVARAKMVCLDLDHPEIVEFVNWKMEKKRSGRIDAGRI